MAGMKIFYRVVVTLLLTLALAGLGYLVYLVLYGPDFELGPIRRVLGNLHPILLHVPIGIFVYIFIVELIGSIGYRDSRDRQETRLTQALGLTVITSLLAAAFGLMLYARGDYAGTSVTYHLWLGIGFTALVSLIFAVHLWADSRSVQAYRFLVFVGMVVIAATGHYGGVITHGNPLQPLVARARTPVPIEVSQEDVFEDMPFYTTVIVPVLEDKCYPCHAEKRQKSGLRLDSIEAMVTGGYTGTALVPGSPQESPISQYINLPLEDAMHMPPEGRPQLTAEQIELIDRWIEAGATADLKIKDAGLSDALIQWAEANARPVEAVEDPADPNASP